MAQFIRELKEDIIKELLNSNLFQERLKKDIISGEVFPAIRNNYIDFYYKGGRLFHFDGKFSTHIKYASVLTKDNSSDYVYDENLKSLKKITNFVEGYERIKENCWNYNPSLESLGVSELYKFSTASEQNKKSIIKLLDIEITFSNKTQNDIEEFRNIKQKKTDRIDILLFNTVSNELKFIEAKHYTNSEIRSNTKPKVIGQINRYTKQIENCENILNAYSKNLEVLKKLFPKSLEVPDEININNAVGLFIFGFDTDQREGRMEYQISGNEHYKTINVYSCGNAKKTNINQFWEKC